MRLIAFVTVTTVVAVLIGFSQFLVWVEARAGVELDDPVLRLFTPVDVSWITFGIIYVSILLWLGLHLPTPCSLLIGLQSYALMVVIRTAAMWLTPLDPPESSLPLIDHMVESLGPSQRLTKDLFFSGHTSTLFLLGLAARTRRLRSLFLILSACVAVCVVAQHAHYTVDVLVAPFMAYGAWSIISRFWVRSSLNDSSGHP